MNSARDNILARLNALDLLQDFQCPTNFDHYIEKTELTRDERVALFSKHISAVHGQVILCHKDTWIDTCAEAIKDKNIQHLAIGLNSPLGEDFEQSLKQHQVELLYYDDNAEKLKEPLFNHCDGAITSSLGAIAQTGSLLLCPSIDEPRLLSLVPPIHLVVLDADKIELSFSDILEAQKQRLGLDDYQTLATNMLLISGPSKTADIEQVLAYGVHGPKELVIIIRQ